MTTEAHRAIDRHLRAVWVPPGDPGHEDMDETTERAAAEVVARRIITNRHESYSIVGDNVDMHDAVMALVTCGDDAEAIVQHAVTIRTIAFEAAVEIARDRYWEQVLHEYEGMLRDYAAA